MTRRFVWLAIAIALAAVVHRFGVHGWVAAFVIGGALIVARHYFYGPRRIRRVPNGGSGGSL